MKIGLLISRLGRGGAERQLMRLAAGLAPRGHTVEVLCYGGPSELDRYLEAEGVRVRNQGGAGHWHKLQLTRQWLSAFQPDVVHGFMKRASSVAALARIGGPRCQVLASDMSTATYGRHKPSLWGSLLLFGLADQVVAQTEVNRRSLETLAPWLSGRTVMVRNGVDTDYFSPSNQQASSAKPFRFVAVGSVYAVKNPVRVVLAAAELARRDVGDFRLDWYGRFGLKGDQEPTSDYQEVMATIRRHGLADRVCFHGDTRDILPSYQAAGALIHASVQEGFPNAVVEGMACGLPIVVSRVSDLPLVVREADNGFVFDETDPVAMADAMQRLMALDTDALRQMGQRSRELAVRWFGLDRFIDDYERLYADLCAVRA